MGYSPHGERLWWLLDEDKDVLPEYKEKAMQERLSAWGGFINQSLCEGLIPFTNDEFAYELFLKKLKTMLYSKNHINKSSLCDDLIDFSASSVALQVFKGYLPDFELHSYEDILAWRDLLHDNLISFRLKITEFIVKIESKPWDEKFLEELKLIFRGQIEPSIEQLKKEAAGYKYKNISTFLKSTLSVKPLPLLATAIIGVPAPIAIGIAAGVITLDAAIEMKKDQLKLQENGLTLLLNSPK